MKMDEQTWLSFDGLELYSITWLPDLAPKAVIAFVHGHGDHCRRYDEWFAHFVDEGFAVVAFDYRGHGRSAGKRGVISHFSDLLNDTNLLVDKTKKRFPNLPIILYGHSMGATIVLSHLQQNRNLPKLAIASSPWLQLKKPPRKLLSIFINLANIIAPSFTLKTGLHSSDFSTVEDFSEKREKDELVHNLISARLFSEVRQEAEKIMGQPATYFTPVLLLHGTDDRITSSPADLAIATKSNGNITFREWENAGHQLHNSENSQAIAGYIIKWINDRL